VGGGVSRGVGKGGGAEAFLVQMCVRPWGNGVARKTCGGHLLFLIARSSMRFSARMVTRIHAGALSY
jgi:hypothetical protein